MTTSPTHEDSSTDCSDSSTDVDGEDVIAGSDTARTAVTSSLKRSAEPLSSASPAKQIKHQENVEPTPKFAKETTNALAFLKSRPQIGKMNAVRESTTTQATLQSLQVAEAASKGQEGLKYAQPEANPSGSTNLPASIPKLQEESDSGEADGSDSWQQHETILDFLRRLPVADPATARVGPWLWVRCARELQRSKEKNLDAFIGTAQPLLDGLCAQRTTIEQQNPGKAVGTITRKMGPYRDQLEIDLLNAATKYSVTSGKWMLFPKIDDLPRVWRQVAEATAEGKLGHTSKVATWEPDNLVKGTLICVYTDDFSDLADVKRVLRALQSLDDINKGLTVYYKCDAYTYLHIFSDNKYKLRASLYSSEEVKNDKVKYKEGVITRLKTQNGAAEGFLNS